MIYVTFFIKIIKLNINSWKVDEQKKSHCLNNEFENAKHFSRQPFFFIKNFHLD